MLNNQGVYHVLSPQTLVIGATNQLSRFLLWPLAQRLRLLVNTTFDEAPWEYGGYGGIKDGNMSVWKTWDLGLLGFLTSQANYGFNIRYVFPCLIRIWYWFVLLCIPWREWRYVRWRWFSAIFTGGIINEKHRLLTIAHIIYPLVI
jgi:hypothetical protein